MIKFLTLRVLRSTLKSTLPKVNKIMYKKLFILSYKYFIYLKPSQIWVILLALLNRTEFSNLLKIPTMFILFSSLFTDSDNFNSKPLDIKNLKISLDANKLSDSENKWENLFWVIIIMALFTRFIKTLFKWLWIPFKIAIIYYLLKYFGFDYSKLYDILNTLSLGVIEWFYDKIIIFFDWIKNNDN